MINEQASRQIARVLGHFGIPGNIEYICPVENGHINHTYLAACGSRKYIVQRINSYVFTQPRHIMHNIEGVTRHLRRKFEAEGRDPDRGTLSYIRDRDDLSFMVDDTGDFWRVCPYIERTRTYEQVENLEMLANAGYAFGEFQRMLSDYPMDSLHETIADFHNTRKRLNDFVRTVEDDACGRAAQVRPEVDFILARRESAGKFCGMLDRGELPLRVTHNDTKYNNILIDPVTYEAVCVIDLDTVMPGLSMYDFGDAIRFAANTALEDETDLSKVTINMDYFEAFTRGFMGASRGAFTPAEVENMAQGAINITVELASRFLADHIAGDRYFHIHRPGQNLDRARNQLKLVSEMEKRLTDMNGIVRRYA